MRHVDSQNGLRWRPAPLVTLSAIVHFGSIVTLALAFDAWPWIAAALAGNHLLLGAATLRPRGRWLGSNIVRIDAAARRGEICLTFDDGPDPYVTPRVLDVLDSYGAKASFFCIGEKAAAQAGLVEEMARRGHSVENHSHRHSYVFAFYGFARLRKEVDQAQAIIARITGRAPEFFRAPVGFRNLLLDPVLCARGLRYVSWTRRGYDAVSNDPRRALGRLLAGLAPGDVLLLHDSRDIVLGVLPALLGEIQKRGWRCVSLPAAVADGDPLRLHFARRPR